MYLPPQFEEKSEDKALQLIKDNPFATLISAHKGEPLINHFPLVLNGSTTLLGHMSAHNPHAGALTVGDCVTAVFHGPHTYITPKWYPSGGVPTWNYAVVHAHGRIRFVREFEPLVELLRTMTEAFEGAAPNPWPFALPDDLSPPEVLTHSIVGFQIEIVSLEAKFKLSQNRTSEDKAGVMRGLATRPDEMSQRVRIMMEMEMETAK